MARRHRSLVLFIVLVVGIGWAVAATNLPGVMIAVAGWRTYLQDSSTALPMPLWSAQMILNFIWSPVFFTLHNMALGLATILTMLAVIVAFIWLQCAKTGLQPLCSCRTRRGSPSLHSSVFPSIGLTSAAHAAEAQRLPEENLRPRRCGTVDGSYAGSLGR